VLATGLAWGQGSPWVQKPGNFEVHRVLPDSGGEAPSRRLDRLSFVAFGQAFDVRLQSNDRLKGGLPPERQARLGHLRFYRGELANRPGSWVRIAENRDVISGLIWDGAGLYSIDAANGELLVSLLENPNMDAGGDFVGDTAPSPNAPVLKADLAAPATAQKLVFPVDPGRSVDVALVADPSFIAERGAATEASMLESLNIVDGIYLWQLGVEIRLTELMLLDFDPFGTNVGEDLLAELAGFKSQTLELRSLGLVHLFTGRDVQGADSGNQLLGSAYIDSVCDTTFGVGFTRINNNHGLEARVVAHELAHNMGAPHDNEAGSACQSTPPGFLMESTFNGTDTFSQCSIDHMLPTISTASCFETWQPNDLSFHIVDAPAVIQYQSVETIQVALDATGLVQARAVEVLLDVSGSISMGYVQESTDQVWICENSQRPVRCTTSYMPAGSTAEFWFDLRTEAFGEGTVHMRVDAGNDTNPGNDALDYVVTVPPTIDAAIDVAPLPGQGPLGNSEVFYVNDVVNMAVTVANRGIYAATNVVAEIEFTDQTTEWQVDSPFGLCALGSAPYEYFCPVGDLAPDQEGQIDISFRARSSVNPNLEVEQDGVNVYLTADETDHGIHNDSRSWSVQVTEAISALRIGFFAPDLIVVDEPVELIMSLENLGPDAARAVRLSTRTLIDGNADLEIASAALTGTSCHLDSRDWLGCTTNS
jgi:hypothetical protein